MHAAQSRMKASQQEIKMDDEGFTEEQQERYDDLVSSKMDELFTGQYAVDVLIGEIQPAIVVLLDNLFKTPDSDTFMLAAIARVLKTMLKDAAEQECIANVEDGGLN